MLPPENEFRTVYAGFTHLTTRAQNRLIVTQAQAVVVAAAILRQLHAIITAGRAWDPAIATHGTRTTAMPRGHVRDALVLDGNRFLRTAPTCLGYLPRATFTAEVKVAAMSPVPRGALVPD